jgi:hypothetical protein
MIELISFIVLADGKCNDISFRPEENNQYWCRRDALCRISTMALYQAPGIKSQVCDDITLLFSRTREEFMENNSISFNENLKNQKLFPAVITMDSNLVDSIPYPTESNLIREWRNSTSFSHKNPQKVFLIPFHKNKKNSNIICTPWSLQSSIVSSFNPWIEASFLNLNDSRDIIDNPCKKIKIENDESKLNIDSFDKRAILRVLQSQCSIEFLRENNLNGSESLILKKRNRKDIESAYATWKNIKLKQNDDTNENKITFPVVNDILRDTFCVLFSRSIAKAKKLADSLSKNVNIKITVLLLHEDYPDELNVFASSENNNNKIIKDSDFDINLCVSILGAVRDATNQEERAILEAAHLLNLRCVGANLGRTAEFTSKIVSSLQAHAISKKLGNALEKLHTIEFPKFNESEIIKKLVPTRFGNWSWDGKNNSKIEIAKKNIEVVNNNGRDCLFFHSVIWLPYSLSDISLEIFNRSCFHQLIQAIVCTLWRSRLGSEAHYSIVENNVDLDKKDINTEDDTSLIKPQLSIIFDNGKIFTITQNELALEMTKNHMAAPSEYQVLSSLIALLRNKDSISSKNIDILSVLPFLLPKDISMTKDKKMVKIVDIQNSFCSNNDIVSSTLSSNSSSNLSFHAYKDDCWCSSNAPINTGKKHVIILFRNNHASSQIHIQELRDIHILLNTFKYGENITSRTLTKDSKMYCLTNMLQRQSDFSINKMNDYVSPGQSITILQHWAYHGRLFPAICDYITNTDLNENIFNN